MNMGIVERTEFLIEQDHVTEAQAETIVAGLERLVDPQQMGSRYKVSQHYLHTNSEVYVTLRCYTQQTMSR
jgi:SAM-dependent MidA family methyltransferase